MLSISGSNGSSGLGGNANNKTISTSSPTNGTGDSSGIYSTRRRVANSLSTILGNITWKLLVKLQSRVCDK
jgi:hypothetical protein